MVSPTLGGTRMVSVSKKNDFQLVEQWRRETPTEVVSLLTSDLKVLEDGKAVLLSKLRSLSAFGLCIDKATVLPLLDQFAAINNAILDSPLAKIQPWRTQKYFERLEKFEQWRELLISP